MYILLYLYFISSIDSKSRFHGIKALKTTNEQGLQISWDEQNRRFHLFCPALKALDRLVQRLHFTGLVLFTGHLLFAGFIFTIIERRKQCLEWTGGIEMVAAPVDVLAIVIQDADFDSAAKLRLGEAHRRDTKVVQH